MILGGDLQAAKTPAQMSAMKDKLKDMMGFMQRGVELLKRDHGEDYEVTPEDVQNIKNAFFALQQDA